MIGNLIRRRVVFCTAALVSALVVGPAKAVDGAILVNQARALAGNITPGDAPGFPISINTPGYYVLTSNLVVPNQNTTAIQVNSNNVTIDLNGFAIQGPNVCATDGFTVAQPCTLPSGSPLTTGIGIDAGTGVAFNVLNTRIINGTIDGVGGVGIFANVNARIEGVNISNTGSYGIYTFGGVIRDVLVRACGSGILTSGGVIKDSRAIFNRGVGIQTGNASVISGNIISTNLGLGLVLTPNSRYTDNTIDNNNGGNGNQQVAGGTSAGVNTCGSAACP